MLLLAHTHTSLYPTCTPSLTLPLPMCLARWCIESSEREFLSVGRRERGREREGRGRVSLEEPAEKCTLLTVEVVSKISSIAVLQERTATVTIHSPHNHSIMHTIQCPSQKYHTHTHLHN